MLYFVLVLLSSGLDVNVDGVCISTFPINLQALGPECIDQLLTVTIPVEDNIIMDDHAFSAGLDRINELSKSASPNRILRSVSIVFEVKLGEISKLTDLSHGAKDRFSLSFAGNWVCHVSDP